MDYGALGDVATSGTDLNGGAEGSTQAAASRKHRYRAYHVVQSAHNAPGSRYHQQHNVAPWPLSRDANSVASPIAPIAQGQALHTTFPSRMRLGVSTLMQPLPASNEPADHQPIFGKPVPIPESFLNAAPSGSRRSGRATANQRRYFEEASDDDDDDEDSDEDDDQGEDGTITNGHGTPAGAFASPRPGLAQQAEEPDRPGQRLGRPLPAHKILVKRAKRTPHIYHSESDAARAADHRELLIPIRIDLETETHRIRDTFTWNVNERLLTPAHFARVFLQDLDLPVDPYAQQIEAAIHQQIQDWAMLAEVDLSPARGGIWACRDPDPTKGEKTRADVPDDKEKAKDARSWDWGIQREFKRHMRRNKRKRGTDPHDGTRPLEGAQGEWEDDMRVLVDYEVQVLQHNLRDRLEWDLSSPLTPEALAAQTCKDLGLSGEALPTISTALRESLLNHKRGVLEMGIIGLGEAWGKAEEMEADARKRLAERATEQAQMQTQPPTQGTTPPPSAPIQPPAPAPAPISALTSTAQTPLDTPPIMSTRSATAAVAAAMEANNTPQQPRSPSPPMSPTLKLETALSTKTDLNNRGPRVLLAPWRDWFEAKEFGPLLEELSVDEIEKREIEAMRSSRRSRRAVGAGFTDSRNTRFRAR